MTEVTKLRSAKLLRAALAGYEHMNLSDSESGKCPENGHNDYMFRLDPLLLQGCQPWLHGAVSWFGFVSIAATIIGSGPSYIQPAALNPGERSLGLELSFGRIP
jgi:hypothetical protein